MKVFLLSFSLLIATSCKYGTTYSSLKSLKDKKIRVESISQEELTNENHQILRDYFSTIKDLTYEFKNNANMRSYTHKKFAAYFDIDFCSEALVSQDIYSELMRKCNISGFYICSDEAQYYGEVLKEIKALFTEFEMSKIMQSSDCKEKLKALRVINE